MCRKRIYLTHMGQVHMWYLFEFFIFLLKHNYLTNIYIEHSNTPHHSIKIDFSHPYKVKVCKF